MKKRVGKKPWGNEEIFAYNVKTTVKVMHVASGKRFSLQKHKLRSEFWKVIDGSGKIVIGSKIVNAKKGDEFFVRKGVKHRIKGGKRGISVLEIAFGKFSKGDIDRLEDDFGRK
jgi:mannose-6-phosphate isomerase